MIKGLNQILLVVSLIVGLSLSAGAMADDPNVALDREEPLEGIATECEEGRCDTHNKDGRLGDPTTEQHLTNRVSGDLNGQARQRGSGSSQDTTQ